MWIFRKALTVVVAVFVLLGGAVVLLGIGAGMLLGAVLEGKSPQPRHSWAQSDEQWVAELAAELEWGDPR
jgi:hypothetical protein